MVLAIVCPGQGSQTQGFLAPWLDLPGARETLGRLSEAGGIDLERHGTVSDEDTIKDTAVAQPLIVGAGLLTASALLGTEGVEAPWALTGHSVGELTALALAGTLTPQAAMSLVAVRAQGMAQASAIAPTGMSAVLGGDPDDVLAVLARHGLTPANRNGSGQVVAAGTLAALDALRADPPARARVIPLKVAGAFHTPHMAPAVAALAAAAQQVDANDPVGPVVSNADGAVVSSGAELLNRLVTQVSNPVRWDLCMETLASLGVTGLVELAPAGTLVGLAKRGLPGVECVALKTPDDLDAARRLVRDHGGAS